MNLQQGSVAGASWDNELNELIDRGILTGAAQITLQGICIKAYGVLKDCFIREPLDKGTPDPRSQFLHLFDFAVEAPTFEILGCKFFSFQHSERSVYAISKGRRKGLCINSLPYGVLITTFDRANFPQTVIPLVEKYCDSLRF